MTEFCQSLFDKPLRAAGSGAGCGPDQGQIWAGSILESAPIWGLPEACRSFIFCDGEIDSDVPGNIPRTL